MDGGAFISKSTTRFYHFFHLRLRESLAHLCHDISQLFYLHEILSHPLKSYVLLISIFTTFVLNVTSTFIFFVSWLNIRKPHPHFTISNIIVFIFLIFLTVRKPLSSLSKTRNASRIWASFPDEVSTWCGVRNSDFGSKWKTNDLVFEQIILFFSSKLMFNIWQLEYCKYPYISQCCSRRMLRLNLIHV